MSLTIEPELPPLWVDEHGVCRIAGTRVTLDSIMANFQDGESAEEIQAAYPSVPLRDVHAVIAFALRHSSEVERYLEENTQRADEQRRSIESELPGGREALRRLRDQREQAKAG